ncbi:MAG: hypothetical protein ACI4AL_05035 [Aristaeellaceae bacterium]
MDGLIVLLIIIGVVTSISKSSKKKKAAAAQKRAEEPSPAQPKAGATKIPYTREEWEQFLADAEGEAAAKPAPAKKAAAKPAAPKPAPQKRKASAPQMNVAAPAPAAMSTGSIALDPRQSVEGETEAEHAAHRLRAAQEDMRIGAERAAEQALAEVNLQTLRSAVVMKEILDKPVSLRPRRRYY